MKTVCLLTALIALTACTGGVSQGQSAKEDLQASCEALVGAETGARPADVSTISTQTEPTGSVISVSVTGAAAPWLCRADASGVITGVEEGQEG
ncbi:hypothetical protein HW561_17090 [Rhodobacteraceae bacterium B1Z28]|uniref:Secreted protein n=1 Tax=Ruegeria haliotis TaxID=2747601 RepID=A0ABX2PV02_9RHOB|nr:hypothetical protein [Ruegeria haliotis]NVO57515.1 hypothetical protein [Ruegeria haliotis]